MSLRECVCLCVSKRWLMPGRLCLYSSACLCVFVFGVNVVVCVCVCLCCSHGVCVCVRGLALFGDVFFIFVYFFLFYVTVWGFIN